MSRTIEVPDGCRVCPACRGEGTIEQSVPNRYNSEYRDDVVVVCDWCMGPDGAARGWLYEGVEFEGVCAEVGGCFSCGDVEWHEWGTTEYARTHCPECAQDEKAGI